jgi:hypothetical protein
VFCIGCFSSSSSSSSLLSLSDTWYRKDVVVSPLLFFGGEGRGFLPPWKFFRFLWEGGVGVEVEVGTDVEGKGDVAVFFSFLFIASSISFLIVVPCCLGWLGIFREWRVLLLLLR